MSMATPPPAAGHPAGASLLPAEGTTIPRWLQLIRAEYLEIPGLRLTEPQVRRLWGLDSVTAEVLLAALLDVKFLKRTPRGSYMRADQG